MVATFQATKLLERVVFWYDIEVRFTSRNHVNMRVPVSSKRILESGMKRSLLVFPEPPTNVKHAEIIWRLAIRRVVFILCHSTYPGKRSCEFLRLLFIVVYGTPTRSDKSLSEYTEPL